MREKRRGRQLPGSNRRINRRLCAVLISVQQCHRRCASSRPSGAVIGFPETSAQTRRRRRRRRRRASDSSRVAPTPNRSAPSVPSVMSDLSLPSPPCLVRSAFLGRDRGISIMLEMKSISILTGDPMAHSERRGSPSPINKSCGLLADLESSQMSAGIVVTPINCDERNMTFVRGYLSAVSGQIYNLI